MALGHHIWWQTGLNQARFSIFEQRRCWGRPWSSSRRSQWRRLRRHAEEVSDLSTSRLGGPASPPHFSANQWAEGRLTHRGTSQTRSAHASVRSLERLGRSERAVKQTKYSHSRSSFETERISLPTSNRKTDRRLRSSPSDSIQFKCYSVLKFVFVCAWPIQWSITLLDDSSGLVRQIRDSITVGIKFSQKE